MGKPERAILLAFGLAVAVGCTWGLPGSDAWCADSISPRSCGLFAIAETYRSRTGALQARTTSPSESRPYSSSIHFAALSSP